MALNIKFFLQNFKHSQFLNYSKNFTSKQPSSWKWYLIYWLQFISGSMFLYWNLYVYHSSIYINGAGSWIFSISDQSNLPKIWNIVGFTHFSILFLLDYLFTKNLLNYYSAQAYWDNPTLVLTNMVNSVEGCTKLTEVIEINAKYYFYFVSNTPRNVSIIFAFKMLLLISFLIFIRGGTPRYRYDYLTKIGWLKFLGFTCVVLFFSVFFNFLL
jgi:hypothetical protein